MHAGVRGLGGLVSDLSGGLVFVCCCLHDFVWLSSQDMSLTSRDPSCFITMTNLKLVSGIQPYLYVFAKIKCVPGLCFLNGVKIIMLHNKLDCRYLCHYFFTHSYAQMLVANNMLCCIQRLGHSRTLLFLGPVTSNNIATTIKNFT